ncbi:hypothetical protein BsWGS_16768 [Bradybaena similaris]
MSGKRVYMSCAAEGHPKPTITWEKNGTEIHLLSERYSINADSNALRIFDIQLEDDGNYTCIAKNEYGVDKMTVALVVMVLPDSKIVSPTNLTFTELTDGELVCRSRCKPRPFFEWLTNNNQRIRFDDTIENDNATNRRLYSIEREVGENVYESVLYFRPMTYKDFGSFACVAYNDIGHSRISANLNVLFSPKVLSQHSALDPVLWWEAHSVNMTCIVAGNDVPEVTWFRNRKRFKCNNLGEWIRAGQITSSCVIKDRSDGGPGVYHCRAKNSLGKTPVHEFQVRENFPPAAVEFTIVSIKLDEVVLAVKIPKRKDTPPTTYVLASYKLAGDTAGALNLEYERMGDVDEHGEGVVKLVGVRENSEYLVKVRARNSVGFGPETESVISTGLNTAVAKTTSESTTVPTQVLYYYKNSDVSSPSYDDEDVDEASTNQRRQEDVDEEPANQRHEKDGDKESANQRRQEDVDEESANQRREEDVDEESKNQRLEEDVDTESTNQSLAEDVYGFKSEGPEALGVRSSSSSVTIAAHFWFSQTNIPFLTTGIMLAFRLQFVS